MERTVQIKKGRRKNWLIGSGNQYLGHSGARRGDAAGILWGFKGGESEHRAGPKLEGSGRVPEETCLPSTLSLHAWSQNAKTVSPHMKSRMSPRVYYQRGVCLLLKSEMWIPLGSITQQWRCLARLVSASLQAPRYWKTRDIGKHLRKCCLCCGEATEGSQCRGLYS